MDPKVSQCPNCQTAFRVTGQQLLLAAGSVRCGSCLHIFQAENHWLAEEEPAETNNNVIDADDPLFDFKINDNTIIPDHLSHEFDFSDDEQDDNHTFSDSFVDLQSIDKGSTFTDIDVFKDDDDGTDEAWARALLEEIEQSSAAELRAGTNLPSSSATAILPPASKTESKDSATLKVQEKTEPFSSQDPGNERQALVDAIESAPLELHQHVYEPWLPKALWGILSLLAIITLVMQYAWFNRAELAHSPTLRPWYQQACTIIGCSLPKQQDVSQISSRNLIIRPDVGDPSQLSLDMIIINNAPYAQPYPNIRITFSDMNRTVISSRALNQDQYLRGELHGSRWMPSQRQIHIALEIVNPSDNIANYTVTFEPMERN